MIIDILMGIVTVLAVLICIMLLACVWGADLYILHQAFISEWDDGRLFYLFVATIITIFGLFLTLYLVIALLGGGTE